MNMSTNTSSDPDVSRPVDSDEDLRTDDDDDDDDDDNGDDNLMASELGTTANANGKCFKIARCITPLYKMWLI